MRNQRVAADFHTNSWPGSDRSFGIRSSTGHAFHAAQLTKFGLTTMPLAVAASTTRLVAQYSPERQTAG